MQTVIELIVSRRPDRRRRAWPRNCPRPVLSRRPAESKARLFAQAAVARRLSECTELRRDGRRSCRPWRSFVPGRIEVLGKHTDYAGGRTMVAAAERGFCMVALPRDDRQMIVIDARTGETVRFQIDPELTPQAGSWSNYPMTVARRVARNFPGAMPRGRHRLRERSAAGRRHEQFQRPDGRRLPGPGRGQPVARPRRVLAQHRQQDRSGRLPGHGRERAELRHA